MTVIPLTPRSRPSPETTIDRLIADHGARAVLLAVLSRLFKRSRPPDRSRHEPEPPLSNAHLRRDIGLDPEPRGPARLSTRDLLLILSP